MRTNNKLQKMTDFQFMNYTLQCEISSSVKLVLLFYCKVLVLLVLWKSLVLLIKLFTFPERKMGCQNQK